MTGRGAATRCRRCTIAGMRIARRMDTIGTETAFEAAARARALEAEGRDIIHLEIGEPDFDTPANIREAAKRALDDGWTHYGPPLGLPVLREAIAADATARKGFAVTPDRVVVTPGAKPIMFYAMLALVDAGDEVIVPGPRLPDLRVDDALRRRRRRSRSRSARSTTSGPTSTSWRRSSRRGRGCSSSTRRPTRPAASSPAATSSAIAELAIRARPGRPGRRDLRPDRVRRRDTSRSPRCRGWPSGRSSSTASRKTYAMTGWRLGYAIVPRAARRACTRG